MQGRFSKAKPVADKSASAMQGNEKNKKTPDRFSGDRKVDRTGRYVFFQEEFEQIMKENEKAHLLDRIDSVIIKHSVREEDSSIFYIYWTDAEKHLHPLKIAYKTSERFLPEYSKHLNSVNLKMLAPESRRVSFNEKQKYGSLTVHEPATRVTFTDEGLRKIEFYMQPLLLIWMSLDGYYGEFRDTREEACTSAIEVLDIYRFLSKFFFAEHIFVVDDVVMNPENIQLPIPLRLIAFLATGKTLYETNLHGMKMLNFKMLSIADDEYVQQNESAPEQSLSELQSLKIKDWYAMLNAEQQKLLTKIFFRNFPLPPAGSRLFRGSRASLVNELPFGALTLQALTAKIYDDFMEKKIVTPSLEALGVLLCGKAMHAFGIAAQLKNQPDFWVKARVNELLRTRVLWTLQQPRCSLQTSVLNDQLRLGA